MFLVSKAAPEMWGGGEQSRGLSPSFLCLWICEKGHQKRHLASQLTIGCCRSRSGLASYLLGITGCVLRVGVAKGHDVFEEGCNVWYAGYDTVDCMG